MAADREPCLATAHLAGDIRSERGERKRQGVSLHRGIAQERSRRRKTHRRRIRISSPVVLLRWSMRRIWLVIPSSCSSSTIFVMSRRRAIFTRWRRRTIFARWWICVLWMRWSKTVTRVVATVVFAVRHCCAHRLVEGEWAVGFLVVK